MNLFPHQQKALDLTAAHNRCAYYLDMGLGKTFVGSEKALELNSRINLVVCQHSKIQDWLDHMVLNYAMNHCTRTPAWTCISTFRSPTKIPRLPLDGKPSF